MLSLFTAVDQSYETVADPNGNREIRKYVTNVRTAKKRLDIRGYSIAAAEISYTEYRDSEIADLAEYLADLDSSDDSFSLYCEKQACLDSSNAQDVIEAYRAILREVEFIEYCDKEYRGSNALARVICENIDEYPLGLPVADIRYTFRLILECFSDDSCVIFDASDLVEGGWYGPDDDFITIANKQLTGRYQYDSPILILTEGSTDKWILERSLRLLHPEYAPLFSFMDFNTSNAAGGASALVATVKSFVGAGIPNRVIALFDNDTAARDAAKVLQSVTLPPNIKCRWLPKPADSWRIARAIANGGGEDRSVAEGRGGVGSQGNRASI